MQNPLIQDAHDFQRQCQQLLAEHRSEDGEDAIDDLRRGIFSSFIGTLGRTDAHKGKFDDLVTDAAEYVDVEGMTVEATPHRISIMLPPEFQADPVVIQPADLEQFEDKNRS